jgi:cardiolipin synthase
MPGSRLAAIALVLAGCATLPDVDPWLRFGAAPGASEASLRRPITPRESQALLAKLERRDASDFALRRQAALEEAVAGTPLVSGNDVALLTDNAASLESMLEAIERATDHINVEFYIFRDDEAGRRFAEALLRKRSQGVAVHLIYDSVGSIQTPREFFDRMRAAGIEVLEFNPVNPLAARSGWRLNHRDHRKLLIVDGRIAFTGGINVSGVYADGSEPPPHDKENPLEWRDINLRLEGPLVTQLQRLFLQSWQKQRGPALAARNWYPEVKPRGRHPARAIASSPDDAVPAIYVSLVSAIQNATRSVRITMAYFAPDPQTLEALKAAAARGAEVTLVLPSYSDFWGILFAGRSHYDELLDAGVAIYERQDRLLHAKTAVIDGIWATVGSSNMDWRSFLHNDELNVVVLGEDFGRQMEAEFRRDLADSRRITAEEWRRRPLTWRVREWAARVWEYWL